MVTCVCAYKYNVKYKLGAHTFTPIVSVSWHNNSEIKFVTNVQWTAKLHFHLTHRFPTCYYCYCYCCYCTLSCSGQKIGVKKGVKMGNKNLSRVTDPTFSPQKQIIITRHNSVSLPLIYTGEKKEDKYYNTVFSVSLSLSLSLSLSRLELSEWRLSIRKGTS